MKKIDDLINKIHCADCLDMMQDIPDKSIDMILCDLPYGTTACSWDVVIPFEPLWEQYKRIVKDNVCICLFGSQPFTSKLIISNIDMFKYCYIWNKRLAGNGILAGKQPLKIHEDICIFGNKIKYNEIMKIGKKRQKNNVKDKHGLYGNAIAKKIINNIYHSKSILDFTIANERNIKKHPTQKPVKLFEYLIKTYTDENDIVLDNCSGSGTTAIACYETNRRFICIEKEKKYVDIARKRLKDKMNSYSLIDGIK